MSGNNPFAQWGAYSGSFISADNQQTVFLPTSIYGALPSGSSTGYGLPMPMGLGSPGTASDATNCNSPSAATGPMQITSFHFTSPTSSILNSSVQGPGKHKFFSIATHGVGHTILIDEQAGPSKGEAVGRVEWQQTPAIVSLMGAVARQTSGQWLSWSHDRRYRVMSARGQEYSWIFNTGMFFLYTSGSSPSEFVARIVKGRGGDGALVSLDITNKAIQNGMLDVCVLAAILFVSGRSLD